jgi:hypothetical protein
LLHKKCNIESQEIYRIFKTGIFDIWFLVHNISKKQVGFFMGMLPTITIGTLHKENLIAKLAFRKKIIS